MSLVRPFDRPRQTGLTSMLFAPVCSCVAAMLIPLLGGSVTPLGGSQVAGANHNVFA